eukprot:3151468-Rhodomonas_salina.2
MAARRWAQRQEGKRRIARASCLASPCRPSEVPFPQPERAPRVEMCDACFAEVMRVARCGECGSDVGGEARAGASRARSVSLEETRDDGEETRDDGEETRDDGEVSFRRNDGLARMALWVFVLRQRARGLLRACSTLRCADARGRM